MLPGINDKRWEKLITGEIKHQFHSVPAGMCVARNIRKVSKNAGAQQKIESIKEVYDFFVKFESILRDDIKAIFG